MQNRTIKVQLPTGLEIRPVAMLVQLASQFESSIYIQSGEKRVNAKSIMGMMTLGLVTGDDLTVSADGTDEDAALDKLASYLSGQE